MTPREKTTTLALVLRDLAALSAFASMAVSGQLPWWTIGFFCAGAALALVQVRLLSKKAIAGAGFLLIGSVVLYGSVATGGMDMVVAASTIAALFALHRMHAAPTPQSSAHVQLTGLLMAAGGTVLSGDVLYAVFLALFTVLSVASVMLQTVQASLGPLEKMPTRRVLRSAGTFAGGALVGGLVFFLLLPRLSWNISGKMGRQSASTGFSDTVRLQSGEIKNNPRVVARVKLAPDPKIDSLDHYWVGHTFDAFNGTEWSSPKSRPRVFRDVRRVRQQPEKAINQRVELLPEYGSLTAFALETPVRFHAARLMSNGRGEMIGFNVAGNGDVSLERSGLQPTYEAWSTLSPVPDMEEPAAIDAEAVQKEFPRLSKLARDIAGDSTDERRVAEQLAQYLRTNYRYSLDRPNATSSSVDNFLFETKEGHCEYFASALTLMLRSLGFQARLATGFYGGERVGESYIVRAGDAHAWTQLWIPQEGYVTFDATPPSFRGSTASVLVRWLATTIDRIEYFWQRSVVDFSTREQVSIARGIAKSVPKFDGPRWSWERWALVIAAAAAAVIAWRMRPKNLRKRDSSQATRLRRAIDKRIRALIGMASNESAPKLEHVLDAKSGIPDESRRELGIVVDRYLSARFGEEPLTARERRTLERKLRTIVVSEAKAHTQPFPSGDRGRGERTSSP